MVKTKSLTPSEERFLQEYMIDRNGTRAYKFAFPDASYATCRSQAARLLAKPNVKAEIRAVTRAQMKRVKLTANRLIQELANIAFADFLYVFQEDSFLPRNLRDIPAEIRRAISKFKIGVTKIIRRADSETYCCPNCGTEAILPVTETTEHDLIEVRMTDKNQSLKMLSKFLGIEKEIPPLEEFCLRICPLRSSRGFGPC